MARKNGRNDRAFRQPPREKEDEKKISEEKIKGEMAKRLAGAYRVFINALSKKEQEIQIAILHLGSFTRRGLIDHLEKGDEIGQEAAHIFCEGTRHKLAEKGVKQLSEDDLVEATAQDFREAAQRKNTKK